MHQRIERRAVAVACENLGLLRKAQRKCSDAAEEIGNAFGIDGSLSNEFDKSRFALLGRLQESAGREMHEGAADPHFREPPLDKKAAVIGQAREV